MKTAILIPARIQSSRFPEKMLQPLGKVPLILHVYNKCIESGLDTFVLTDSKRVASIIPNAIMTEDADNGTERCCQVMEKLDYDQFVNVQGDMPDIAPNMIVKILEVLGNYKVATIFTDMPEEKQKDPNTVKLITNGKEAHWFCRASLDYGVHHLGVYGYKKEMAQVYMNAEIYKEERVEKLEQLRWLQNGEKIGVAYVPNKCIEINAPEDVDEWMKTQNL